MEQSVSDETPWFEQPLAVVDVETTGLDPETDRVIEIAVISMVRGEVVERYSSLVDPGCELPAEVTNITGIKPEDLVGAASFPDVAAEVVRHLEGKAFVAYNLAFDRTFIRAELGRAGIEWQPALAIDPLIFVRELHRDQGSKRLEAVAKRMGVELSAAHRAAEDAEAAGHVLYALRDQLPAALSDLLLLQSQWAQQQDNEMAGWRNRRESAFDEGVAGSADRGNALGPAYIYGDDTDPVRAMFAHLPDAGSRR